MTDRHAGAPQPLVVIEARPETFAARLRALWRYRAFYAFLFKEITTRKSRGTLLGFWWLIIRPLIPAVALIVVFGSVRPVDTGAAVSYPIFFLSGYIFFRLFQSAMIVLPRTLGWTASIMRRTYFPRLLVPLAGFGNTLIEFGILSVAFAVIVGYTTWNTGTLPLRLGWQTLWVLPSLAMALLFALAGGLVISVVALFFRDIIFSTRFAVQLFLFLTPVVWPIDWVAPAYRWLFFAVNPMAQVVIVGRWALTGAGALEVGYVLLSYGAILAMLAASLAFFFRAEALLGDQM